MDVCRKFSVTENYLDFKKQQNLVAFFSSYGNFNLSFQFIICYACLLKF